MTDEMRDPRRLFDDPETSDALRSALGAARDDLPTEGELASLASRLGPLLGGPGAGGGGGGGAPADPSALAAGGSGAAAKAIGVIVATAAVGGAIWWGTSATERAPRPSPEPRAEAVEAPRPSTSVEIPQGIDVPEEAIDEAEPDVRPRPTIEAPALEHDPEAELALVRSAQDALRTSPSSALDLTREHERRFGEGTLAQEREVVAIDALVRLGRADDARARAERFYERWPRSAHRRRIEVLLAP